MRILLPPSEGKVQAGRARPLDLETLSFPSLNPVRTKVVDALVQASRRPDALEVLGAPKGACAQVAANVDLWCAPTRPVSELYTGVLYDALSWPSLGSRARRRGNSRLIVISALFGALQPTDEVPPYRLAMGADLPGVGKLAQVWREPLAEVLPGERRRGVVVDLRSSTYVAAWRPRGDVAERTVSVHVVRDGPGGRTAVSHMAKHTRGLVARHLLSADRDPRTPEEVAEELGSAFEVAGLEEHRPGKPRRLEVVEPA